MSDKMTWDQANAIEAWQTVERKEASLKRANKVLLDVEGSLLAYWTDLPESECQRLTVEIRAVLAGQEKEA